MGNYVVRAGDSLGKIAQRTLGSSQAFSAIAKANQLSDSDKIYPGQVLKIPDIATENELNYTVEYGDTLWSIAHRCLGSPYRWKDIANLNHITDANFILVGQVLKLPLAQKSNGQANESEMMGFGSKILADNNWFDPNPRLEPFGELAQLTHPLGKVSNSTSESLAEKRATLVPARAFFFILADEFDPFRKKWIRRVAFPEGLETNPKLLYEILNPDVVGFKPRGGPNATTVTPGRHVLGRVDSDFISVSERPLRGAPRHGGKRYWIDAKKLKDSGAQIFDAKDIAKDLDRILAKTKDPIARLKIEKIRELALQADRELLVKGPINPKFIKGAGAHGLTRGMQFIQGVGIVLSAYDLTKAGMASYKQDSIRPIAAETVRQVGGWSGAWAGAQLGAAGGALVGIEGGPLAIVTGAAGAIIGGAAGFFGADWIAKYIEEKEHKEDE